MNDPVVSKHGERRMRNRMGVPKKSTKRMAKKALEFGLTHSESSGRLHRYLDKLVLSHDAGATIRIYHQYVYLFGGERLITAFILPNNLQKTAAAQVKRRDQKNNDRERVADCVNEDERIGTGFARE